MFEGVRGREGGFQHLYVEYRWGFAIRVVLRYGLERPVIIRIYDHLDGFRMIRLAFYIRES